MHPTRRYFEYKHLPVGPLRNTSARFSELAGALDDGLPDGAWHDTKYRIGTWAEFKQMVVNEWNGVSAKN